MAYDCPHATQVLPIRHHPLACLHFWTALICHSGRIQGMIPAPGKHWGHVGLVLPLGLFLGLQKGPKKCMVGEAPCPLQPAVASGLPQNGLHPHSISKDSIQSTATFNTSAMLEKYSASKANLPSSTVFILLCHSPDQAQSTLKRFASQNSPIPPRQFSGQ